MSGNIDDTGPWVKYQNQSHSQPAAPAGGGGSDSGPWSRFNAAGSQPSAPTPSPSGAPDGGSPPPPDAGSGGSDSGGSSEYPEDSEMGDVARGAARGIMEGVGGIFSFVPDAYASLYNATEPYNFLAQHGIGPKHIGSLGNEIQKGIDKAIPPSNNPVANLTETGTAIATGAVAGSAADKLLEEGISAAGIASRHTAIERAVVSDARAHGVVLSPEYIGGSVSKAAQTMSGGPRVSQAASQRNIDVVDRMAKAQLAETHAGVALGLSPESVELAGPMAVFDKIRDYAYSQYKAVAQQLGVIPENAETKPLWDKYFKQVRAAGGRHAKRIFSPFGNKVPTPLALAKLQYLQPQEGITADEMMDEVRILREQSRANLHIQDAEKNPLGKGQFEVAKALDDLIGGYAEMQAKKGIVAPDLFKNYLDARQDLAIAATYEGSVSHSGHVVSKALAKLIQSKQGRAATGAIRKIGTWAAMFPKDFQPMYEKGEQGMFSAVDYLLGGSGIIFHHPVEVGLVAFRPIAKKTVLSKTVQDSMAKRYAGEGIPWVNKGIPIGGAAAAEQESDNQ